MGASSQELNTREHLSSRTMIQKWEAVQERKQRLWLQVRKTSRRKMRKSRPREKCVLVGGADPRRSSRVGQQQRLHVFITHEERQSTASMGSCTHTTKSLFWTRTLDVNADTWRDSARMLA